MYCIVVKNRCGDRPRLLTVAEAIKERKGYLHSVSEDVSELSAVLRQLRDRIREARNQRKALENVVTTTWDEARKHFFYAQEGIEHARNKRNGKRNQIVRIRNASDKGVATYQRAQSDRLKKPRRRKPVKVDVTTDAQHFVSDYRDNRKPVLASDYD